MQLAARPYVTVGVALAAAGIISVTPVAPPLPDVQVPDIELTSLTDTLSAIGADLGANTLSFSPSDLAAAAASSGGLLYNLSVAETGFNEFLLSTQTSFNTGLVAHELALEELIFGTDSALNGTINRLFNVGNMFVDTFENTFNGFLFGANPDITSVLTVGMNALGELTPNLFNSGMLGGIEGVFNNTLAAFFDFLGLFL